MAFLVELEEVIQRLQDIYDRYGEAATFNQLSIVITRTGILVNVPGIAGPLEAKSPREICTLVKEAIELKRKQLLNSEQSYRRIAAEKESVAEQCCRESKVIQALIKAPLEALAECAKG